jgi:hypothetical protein
MRLGNCGNISLLILVAELALFVCAGFDGHHLQPPAHHAVRLGKEAVTANVHAVALVTDSARDAADLIAGFDHNRFDCGKSLEFDTGRHARRARPDNDCRLLGHILARLY